MKIAIVGTASSSNLKAPYDDPAWDVWTLGKNWQLNKRYDKFFEMHKMIDLAGVGVAQKYLDFLKIPADKLVLCEPCANYPAAQIFPKQEVMDYFAATNPLMGKYFTSTIAWLIAYAILLDAKEIGVWGVDLIMDEEYAYQRCCVEMFLGFAIARGIKITIADESPIMRATCLYGFEDRPPLANFITARIKDVEAEHAKHKQTMVEAGGHVNYKQGQLDILKSLERLVV